VSIEKKEIIQVILPGGQYGYLPFPEKDYFDLSGSDKSEFNRLIKYVKDKAQLL
jgi:hypothetical protein